MKIDKIDPTRESIKALVSDYPKDTPVTMLNILRFKSKVDGKDETGLDAYKRYGSNAKEHIIKAGAKIVFAGEVKSIVIGDTEGLPHQVILVEYPSVSHFLNMTMSPEYQAITHDRTMALEYGGLIACKAMKK